MRDSRGGYAEGRRPPRGPGAQKVTLEAGVAAVWELGEHEGPYPAHQAPGARGPAPCLREELCSQTAWIRLTPGPAGWGPWAGHPSLPASSSLSVKCASNGTSLGAVITAMIVTRTR